MPTDAATAEDRQRLHAALESIGPVVVAFSGGADSALVAHRALHVLGPDQVLAVTADSVSLASGELEHCSVLASGWGLPWRSVRTDELDDERYVRNDADRCRWCKSSLMDRLEPIAAERSATVVLGVNTDDLHDHRPGQAEAARRGARFPLVEAGLDKAAVRRLSRALGLSTWDRPAMPCLASRVPYHTPVSVEVLGRIDRAEAAIRSLGFPELRVRHFGHTARVEVPLDDLPRLRAVEGAATRLLVELGFERVELDDRGLRSGSLNEALQP